MEENDIKNGDEEWKEKVEIYCKNVINNLLKVWSW